MHAGQQNVNREAVKVKFVEKAGCNQVVLARELYLEQLRDISSKTNVPLEIFVHGALCVSYSGQCYISEALSKRSANKGACAQYCRLPYELVDATGKVPVKSKHPLSLKDVYQSDSTEQLFDAGATALTIKGRLRDIASGNHIVAYYANRMYSICQQLATRLIASARE